MPRCLHPGYGIVPPMTTPLITRRRLLEGAAAGAAVTVLPATAFAKRIKKVDVVVVGAGISGLAAARAIKKKGHSVVVLEARDRVGGRLLNTAIAGGHITEIGGEYVGPTQDRIKALADAVGVKRFPTYNTGSNVLIVEGQRSLYDAVPGIPSDPDVLKSISELATFDTLAKDVGVKAPWRAKRAAEFDKQTLADWINTNISTPKGRAIANVAAEAIWGAEPKEMSLLYALTYVAGAGNSKTPGSFLRLITTSGGAQEERFVGGSQEVAIKVAAKLGSAVRLEHPVRRIARRGRGVRVIADGLTIDARQAIVAVPPVLTTKIDFTPLLSPSKRKVLKAMVPGRLIKAEAIYDRPFWRDAGLSGQSASDVGPANTTFDNSPPDGSVGVLFGFVGGDSARSFQAMAPADRRAAVLENLVAVVGEQARTPTDYFEQDWSNEQWTRGCPVGHIPPGVLRANGAHLRTQHGAIHFAGTETADYWLGYMDGGVRAGERAAREVLHDLKFG
jgi:monoamine oxidase